IDPRIDSTVVSGYFGPREHLWEEPIYRNVWGLLRDFGDAEIARLVAPRSLVIEASVFKGSPAPAVRKGRAGAAPGLALAPGLGDAISEFRRITAPAPKGPLFAKFKMSGPDDPTAMFGPGQPHTFQELFAGLKASPVENKKLDAPRPLRLMEPEPRQKRQ